jgi:NADPH:quinone reductase-like Zn-dependent oxidoreductase
MQAAINTHYGTPQVLSLAEVERPTISPHQILIEVQASTVTEGDRRLRAADYPGISALLGRLVSGLFRPRASVGGSTFAGRVVEVGAQVTRFQRGDDVFGSTMSGAYGQYLAIGANQALATMPSGLSYAEAAAIPYGGGTALTFLKDMARVRAGERVVVVGASGGVGRMAVQVAKHLGAHVSAVCSGDADLVRRLGADEVIDYKKEDFTKRGELWDVILDMTEGNHFSAFRGVLTPRGRYLTVYMSVTVLLQMLWTKWTGGQRALTGVAMGSPESSDALRDLVQRGGVRAVIAQRYPLAQAREAHWFFERARPHGTVVIDVAQVGSV